MPRHAALTQRLPGQCESYPVHGMHLVGNFCSLQAAKTFAEDRWEMASHGGIDACPMVGEMERRAGSPACHLRARLGHAELIASNSQYSGQAGIGLATIAQEGRGLGMSALVEPSCLGLGDRVQHGSAGSAGSPGWPPSSLSCVRRDFFGRLQAERLTVLARR